ncbi:heterokaryon incompatibility protein-domain-containing protein [Rhypophila decipiens]|uniref:Heterokaryon incompatibility protein-domain-containing protein n=1 Tax=Rhypophila decipiens TaxID=261697 RepID=A0AAN7B8L0_9PEZI|nr:heterokaryon incompatibility protein-domain-containing protein [Rhypophila decipiens]
MAGVSGSQTISPQPSAARDLRHRRHKSRTLWIDAICINQNDVTEKNIQLPLMGRIYSESTRVVAYLGAESGDSTRTTCCLHQDLPRETLDFLSKFSSRGRKERLLALVQAYRRYLAFEALPYWSRMWTFQEFFLPKNEPVCTMGGLQFRGTSMRDAGILLVSSTEKATGWDVAMMTQAGIEFTEVQMMFDAWRELMERSNTLFIRPGQGDDGFDYELDMTTLMLAIIEPIGYELNLLYSLGNTLFLSSDEFGQLQFSYCSN